MIPYKLIHDPMEWERVAALFKQGSHIAIDMESNSFFKYPEYICLIQLAIHGPEVFILDPLAVKDLSALGEIAANPAIEKVFHGSDYDLRSFDREYGFRFKNLFDTGVAIQLLSPTPLSLLAALKQYLGVEIAKSKKLQRADWSHRPLAKEQLDYGAGDVAHLIPLRDVLEAELVKQGRLEWAREEFSVMEQTRFVAPDTPEEALFSVKGTFQLTPHQLAMFRRLFLFREEEARRLDRPPFKVISNDVLLELAKQPHHASKIKGLSRRNLMVQEGAKLKDILSQAEKDKPLEHASRHVKKVRNPWTTAAHRRFKALQEERRKFAGTLNIAPFMLWPTKSLERMAIDLSMIEAEISGESIYQVRRWQRQVFGETLKQKIEEIKKAS